ncbi:MAG: zinc-binding dehydrogenase [Myxococcota bacterium]
MQGRLREARWSPSGIEVTESDPAPVRAGWVRLRVEACGLCGTDLHLYRGDVPRSPGAVPGHEIAGSLLDGPAGLEDTLYAVEPLLWCGHCDPCLGGRRHLCLEGRILGIGARGGLADWVDVPEGMIHAVPSDVSARLASLSEPLAVGVRAVHRARVQAQSRVLVLGAGSIGLLAGLLARDVAREVAITARYDHQLQAAKRLGLTPLAEGELADWARDAEPDVVIETVGGAADTLEAAVQSVRRAGRIVVVGVFSEPRPVDLLSVLLKEIELVGSNTYGQDRRGPEFRAAVGRLERYRRELASLQTHQFPLAAIGQAFECAADKRSGAIKVTVEP